MGKRRKNRLRGLKRHTLARGMRVGIHGPVRILPDVVIDAVPIGAVGGDGGSRRSRSRHGRGEDSRRRSGVGLEHHSIHGLADGAELQANVVDGGIHLGLPLAELAGRILDALEAIAERVLHALDALGDRRLEIRHGHREGLDLVENGLQIGLHSADSFAEPGEMLVVDFVGIQISVSDTTLLAAGR